MLPSPSLYLWNEGMASFIPASLFLHFVLVLMWTARRRHQTD